MATVEEGRQTRHTDGNGLCGLCSETRDGRGGARPASEEGGRGGGARTSARSDGVLCGAPAGRRGASPGPPPAGRWEGSVEGLV